MSTYNNIQHGSQIKVIVRIEAVGDEGEGEKLRQIQKKKKEKKR